MKRVYLIAFWVLWSGCQQVLLGNLGEAEANEIMVTLAEKGVPASKERLGSSLDSWMVMVTSEDLQQAFIALRSAGLPRLRHEGFKEIYKERGLIPGRLEEKALFLSALQGEIAETLELVEGITSARVHITVAGKKKARRLSLNPEPPSQPTASVLISYQTTADDSLPLSAKAVKKLVAHSVSGLVPEKVAVVFSPREKIQVTLPQENGLNTSILIRPLAVGVAVLVFLLGLLLLAHRRGWLARSNP
jgi:type III secretion protein J